MAVRIEDVPNSRDALRGLEVSEAVLRAVEAGAATRREYQQKRAESKDGADLARAGLAMVELQRAHAEETAGQPLGKQVSVWEKKYRKAWEERFFGLNPSANVREAMEPKWIDFEARYQVEMRYAAERAELEADRVAMVEGFNMALGRDDFETALVLLGHLRQSGHITEAQETAMWEEGESAVRNRGAKAFMAEYPVNFQREMTEAEASGRSDIFEWMKPEDITRYKGAVDAAMRTLRVEKRREISGKIREGGITNERQLREAAGNVFDEEQLGRWKQSLSADVPYDAGTVGVLRTAVANYDARADRDLSGYEALMTRIETSAPKDAQGPLAEELHQAYAEVGAGKAPSTQARMRGELFARIDELPGNGLLAGNGAVMAQGMKDEAEALIRERRAMSLKDGEDWLMERVAKDRARSASETLASPWGRMMRGRRAHGSGKGGGR